MPEISGQLHPLFAAYRKETLEAITESLKQNQLRIRQLLHTIHVKIIKNELLESLGIPNEEIYFFNMNNREEYHKALQSLKIKVVGNNMKFFQVKSVEETFSLIEEMIHPLTEKTYCPFMRHFIIFWQKILS